jgi:DNA transformation protein
MRDESFTLFVLDQLSQLPGVRAQSMFGGLGLYQAERFFGILMAGRLYFKVDEKSRAPYLEYGRGLFCYEKAGRMLTMNYYEVPPDILECQEELVAWANQAILVASASPKKLTGQSSRRR